MPGATTQQGENFDLTKYTLEQTFCRPDSITYNPEADLGDLDVIVVMSSLLLLKHEVVDLFKEGGPLLIRRDLKHPLLLSSLDLGHLDSLKFQYC
jgi:hypothetical protein